jgi:TetR/AcrR family transcriptional regulator
MSRDPSTVSPRRRQIVEATLALVRAHGVEAVSAQRIANAIGVTQPAVFRHFPTKEAIWLAVMDWLEERLVAIYAVAEAAATEDALVALSRMFLMHLRLIERYPALAQLVLSDGLRRQYPAVQARFGRIHRGYMARLGALLARARSAGMIRDRVAPADAATAFLSLVQGLAFQFAVARLPIELSLAGERALSIYLGGIVAAAADVDRFVRPTIGAARRQVRRSVAA